MTIEDRAKQRRQRIVMGRTDSFEEAELWDLKFWQSLTPEDRLEAYMAIRADVEKVNAARKKDTAAQEASSVK